MSMAARAVSHLMLFVVLGLAGAWLWRDHASAWDLGRRSPVLSYDAAENMLAARELVQHGRFATTCALPLELARHSQPPWPLARLQPGPVMSDALLYRMSAAPERLVHGRLFETRRPDEFDALSLMIPCTSYVLIAIAIAFAVSRLLRLWFPGVSTLRRALAGGLIGLSLLLDPESQHYAVQGLAELPFTLGLVSAVALLALGSAARWPLLFGLLLGATGAFHGAMLWLAPALAAGTALSTERGHRVRRFSRVMIGYAIPLIPWWLYKWHAFGTPAWDLSALALWDGVEGRSLFVMFHQCDVSDLPHGWAAVSLISGKLARTLPQVASDWARGLTPVLAAALALWLMSARTAPRPLRAAAVTAFALSLIAGLAAALGAAQLRDLYPTSVALEAAGVLALLGLVSGAANLSGVARRLLISLIAVLVVGWGAWQTWRGNVEAREASQLRGTPNTLTLLQIASIISREVPTNEPVMSNLGAVLAWESRRPVIQLAAAPEDLPFCRRRMDFRRVVLVFRDADHAWPAWRDVVAHPTETLHRTEMGVRHVRRFDSADGFQIIWLDLAPLGPELAAR